MVRPGRRRGRAGHNLGATHGAEGFCGSAVQAGWFESGLHRELPRGVALFAIHAINPSGFAWLRRVTEDNVDLNRNFLAHGGDYPANQGYDELHAALCPRDWDDASLAETARIIEAYREQHGAWALQKAISGGQYNHADGIFYGGNAETWSRGTMVRILRENLGGARRVAVVDYHHRAGPARPWRAHLRAPAQIERPGARRGLVRRRRHLALLRLLGFDRAARSQYPGHGRKHCPGPS